MKKPTDLSPKEPPDSLDFLTSQAKRLFPFRLSRKMRCANSTSFSSSNARTCVELFFPHETVIFCMFCNFSAFLFSPPKKFFFHFFFTFFLIFLHPQTIFFYRLKNSRRGLKHQKNNLKILKKRNKLIKKIFWKNFWKNRLISPPKIYFFNFFAPSNYFFSSTKKFPTRSKPSKK